MKISEAFPAPDAMERLAARIEAETGLCFPAARRHELKNGVRAIARAMGFEHEESCLDWFLSASWDKTRANLCALHLTVGETYFFREPRAFELLCDYARKSLADPAFARRQLRIWSAGCCTGEEPYSIAMALRNAVPELDPDRISILATDISSRNLQVARTGRYRQWSFRSIDAALKKRYFVQDGAGTFRISSRIRELVRFAELNLASPAYPAAENDTQAMDIIFCRNVLMYFSKDHALKVIERLRRCLIPGGWLIVSPSEASGELFPGFSATYYPDAIYFQKTDGHEEAQAQPPAFVRPPAPTTIPAVPDVRQSTRRGERKSGMAARACPPDRTTRSGQPDADVYLAKAQIAIESGDRAEAIRCLKRVLYLSGDCILAHYLMGVLHLELDRNHDAARHFEAVDELLKSLSERDAVPDADGLSAAYLQASVRSYLQKSSA